ncbi:hypothetical protein CPB83DRAFT_899671 [Crepidotus variabilis]|uniref:Uncharacterized protein n=1 Tax=Crepidotus variabilis TaxID=179855 RepID=A0A9P6E4G5_9AGAR|nr:hypothetical protein CPB83DRAFT_899671 [Crepidotus variabilis]
MLTYTLNVKIQSGALARLGGFHLYMAKGFQVDKGKITWKVVAVVNEILAKTTFTWSEGWETGGAKMLDSLAVASTHGPIPLSHIDDPPLPAFQMQPVLKTTGDEGVDTVVLPAQGPTDEICDPIASGTSQLTPVLKIALWFEKRVETSIIVDTEKSKMHVIDFAGRQSATTTYTDAGRWLDDSD